MSRIVTCANIINLYRECMIVVIFVVYIKNMVLLDIQNKHTLLIVITIVKMKK